MAKSQRTSQLGFSLAEVLVVLAILSLIATFTIPKVIIYQQTSTSSAKAKDVIAMISGAYQIAQNKGVITGTSKPTDLTPYMNYLSTDITSQIDWDVGQSAAAQCSSTNLCLNLHGGGKLMLYGTGNFGGTATTNVVMFVYDPDGLYVNSAADGPSKSLVLLLYYNGFITSGSKQKANTCDSNTCPWSGGSTTEDPTWFVW